MSREKKLLKHTVIYAIGNFGSKALNILLLPFYTRVLTQAEYGSIDIVLISLILLSPFVSVNMGEAVFRFSVDKKYNKEQVLNAGLIISILGFFVTILTLPLVNLYFNNMHLLICFSVLLIAFVLQSILKQYTRAIEKLNLYMISDFVQVISFVGFIFVFVGEYDMGLLGFIYAKIISLFIDFLLLFIVSTAYKSFRSGINFTYGKEMMYFGIPLIPNSVMWWISNASDRYLLAAMVGMSSVGIYSVATKFPIILAQFSTVFFKSWQSSAIEQDAAKDSSEYHTKVFNGYAVILFLISSLILICIKPLMLILVADDFYIAWKYIPFLLLGAVFSALAGFLGINYNVAKKTKKALFSTIVAAVVNIILNIILIPYYEVMGASIATLVSFIILLGIRMYETPQYKDIKFNYSLLTCCSAIFLFQSVIMYYITSIEFQVILQLPALMLSLYLFKKQILKSLN
ncbi:oligosaccharide flippase family protein [Pseudoalteromonas sp. MMG006]|uniref:lipopolysaccharide biosynthesis protein n=1 Tax=Pseudoalteromonas sp. MMG006 TaxID=2822683 RepID=UPI001B37DA67|nr:oligosaccharide flippase family protein [Pseudoalteromonas sp. MMG006]